MPNSNFLLVDKSVLPEVIVKVAQAKKLLAQNEIKSNSQAAKEVGISRGAFYKYKDYVFDVPTKSNSDEFNLLIKLLDEPGQLAKIIETVSKYSINIKNINQNTPLDGVALVSITAMAEDSNMNFNELMASIENLSGVVESRYI